MTLDNFKCTVVLLDDIKGVIDKAAVKQMSLVVVGDRATR